MVGTGEEGRDAGGLPAVLETAGTLATGLPPEIRKSFWKACGRVFTGAAEWPAAWLEGKAEVARAKSKAEAEDILAKQRARSLIDLESAKHGAALFADPGLGRRALDYHAAEIVREQATREDVLRRTAEALGDDPLIQDAAREVDDDWLHLFFKEVGPRSGEEMKALFGRILAGEIRRPGSFSIQTLRAVGCLTQEDAATFQRFCDLSSVAFGYVKVFTGPYGSASNDCLKALGLTYFALTKLVESGLLRSDLNEYITFPKQMFERRVPFEHAGKLVWLGVDEQVGSVVSGPLQIHGPTLSRVGTELRGVVTMTPDQQYLGKLKEWFAQQDLVLFREVRREGENVYGEPV